MSEKTSYCKQCNSDNCKRYYQRNKEIIKEKTSQYYYENKNRALELRSIRYKNNREKVLLQQKEYRDREEIKERLKQYRIDNAEILSIKKKKYREANKEKILAYDREWKLNNKEKLSVNDRQRRARLASAVSEKYSKEDIIKRYGTCCHICGEEIDLKATRIIGQHGWEKGLHLDHIIPLSKGGSDTIENVKPAHGYCNLSKSNKLKFSGNQK